MAQAPDAAREASTALGFASFFALLAVAMAGFGVRQLAFTVSGPQATATVRHCELYQTANSLDTHCTGTWTLDGRPAHGTIVGVDDGAVGTTVRVSVHGDTAYSHSLLSPVVLLVVSVAVGGVAVIGFRRSRARVSR